MSNTVSNRNTKKRKRPTPPLPIGDVVNGYRLVAIIGRGGMGTVYRGKHELLGREAAVKVLSKTLWQDQEFLSRFFHEAQVANNIKHPCIVDILDFVNDKEPRRIAYIMELVAGPSLKHCLKHHDFSLHQAINLTAQLTEALKAAHAVGVIHRDLKPSNILVIEPMDTDLSLLPSVKLLDFGIAKITQGAVGHQTMQGTVLGTPKYMAPEQISAEPVSPATDVYALGELFFEMATGNRVFNGQNNMVMAQKLSGALPKLPCPPDLNCADQIQELTKRCLALDPKQRIGLDEFYEALLQIRNALGVADSVPITRRRKSSINQSDDSHSIPPLPASTNTNTDTSTGVSPLDEPLGTQTNAATKKPLFLFGVLAIITIGLAVLFVSNYKQVIPEQSPQTKVTAPPPAPTAETKKTTVEAKPAPSRPTMVKLTCEPTRAEVIDVRGGKLLGTTPYEVAVKPDESVKLVLQADGYKPLPISVEDTSTVAHFRLKKSAPVKTSPQLTPKRGPAPVKPARPKAPKTDTAPMKRQDLPSW